jgi:ribosomal protein L10
MASEKILSRKKEVVSEIKDIIENNGTLILFDYRGLTDKEAKAIRRELRKNEDDYKIYKNTLLKLAFNDKGINLDEALSGPSALAYGKGQLSAIKTLSKFAKTNKNLEIKMGYVDNEVADLNKINSLAALPSRDELLTMLAGGMIGVVRNLAIGLDLVSKQKENN